MWRGISYERTAFFQNTNPILNKTLVLQAITAVTTPLPFSSTLATADYHRTRHSSPIKKYSVTTCLVAFIPTGYDGDLIRIDVNIWGNIDISVIAVIFCVVLSTCSSLINIVHIYIEVNNTNRLTSIESINLAFSIDADICCLPVQPARCVIGNILHVHRIHSLLRCMVFRLSGRQNGYYRSLPAGAQDGKRLTLTCSPSEPMLFS